MPILSEADQQGLLDKLSAFKAECKAYDEKLVQDLHYMLCCAVDEFRSVKQVGGEYHQSCLLHFHSDNLGGVKFFKRLEYWMAEPKRNPIALEFGYMLLVLGFEGHYRLMADGQRQRSELCSQLQLQLQQVYPRNHWLLPKKRKSKLSWQVWVLITLFVLTIGLWTFANLELYKAAQPLETLIHQVIIRRGS